MLITLVIAVGLVSGVPWAVTAVVLVGIWQPLAGIALVAGSGAIAALRGRAAPSVDTESALLGALAAELRGGAALRSALAAAAGRVPSPAMDRVVRLALAGAPMERVAMGLSAALPLVGAIAAPALEIAATSGGRAATVFATLAERSAVMVEIERERKALSAQARLSAFVVGGLPCVVLAVLVASGRLSAVLESGTVGAVSIAAGSVLLLVGAGAVVVMTRRLR